MGRNGFKPARPAILPARDILTPQRIEVAHEFDRVVFKAGNVEIKMTYEAALQLSQWFKLHGLAAKRFAGDTSKRMRVAGILHDANAPQH